MQWIHHDKYAHKIGVDLEQSRYVNIIIDNLDNVPVPSEYIEFVFAEVKKRQGKTKSGMGWVKFLSSAVMEHDSGGKKKSFSMYAHDIQTSFLAKKGDMYVRAWYLHHILDYTRWWTGYCQDLHDDAYNFEQFVILLKKRRPAKYHFPDELIVFVCKNFNDIINDCLEEIDEYKVKKEK